MKYRILLFTAFIIAARPSTGQNVASSTLYPDNIENAIIREISYPKTVGYVETISERHFTYNDANNTVLCHTIDTNIHVLDMVVYKDSVYFCGYLSSPVTRGVVGRFSLTDLYSTTLNYEIYSGFVGGGEYVDTLYRMVVYEAKDVVHTVAVGTTTDGIMKRNGCTIDITPVAAGQWNYTIGITEPNIGMRLNRICLTDNYVIMSGPSHNANGVVTYRRHSRGNVFDPVGTQDDIWYFVFSWSNAHLHNTYNYEITHIASDSIAAAVQSTEYGTYPYSSYAVFVTVFDMSNPIIGLIQNTYSHFVSTGNNILDVRGVRYDPTHRSFVILTNGTILNGFGSAITEIPLSSNIVNIHLMNDVEFTSLDLFNGQQNFLCHGNRHSMSTEAILYTQTLSTNTSCTQNFSTQSSEFDLLTKGDYSPYTVYGNTFKYTPKIQNGETKKNNDIICMNR